MRATNVVNPNRLKVGDKVRLISPASTPDPDSVASAAKYLESLGLHVQVGRHALDRFGLFAGTDEARLADLDDALRDPETRAIIATRGGRGAYRIADGLDFEAARRDPKLLVGFSEITILHMALLRHGGIAGVHGAAWDDGFDRSSAESFRNALFRSDAVTLRSEEDEPTAALSIEGTATGLLIGGNQDMLATASGWMLPELDGAILLLEAVGLPRGQLDRQLTMLRKSGALSGIVGVAVGQYTDCGRMGGTDGNWGCLDILRDQLGRLDVPVLGGLRIGHGSRPLAVPIGTRAIMNASAGTLEVEAAVR